MAACKVFLCTETAFDFRQAGEAQPLYYCEEHAEAMGLSALGKSFDDGVAHSTPDAVTEATRARLEAGVSYLQPKTKDDAMPRKVICVETNQTFDSIVEASKATGVAVSSLYTALSGNGRAGGKTWKKLVPSLAIAPDAVNPAPTAISQKPRAKRNASSSPIIQPHHPAPSSSPARSHNSSRKHRGHFQRFHRPLR